MAIDLRDRLQYHRNNPKTEKAAAITEYDIWTVKGLQRLTWGRGCQLIVIYPWAWAMKLRTQGGYLAPMGRGKGRTKVLIGKYI